MTKKREIQQEVPSTSTLPPRKTRLALGAPPYKEFSVELETTTPILGGAPKTRTIDEADVIRVPSIRGHLRFWWRALIGHNYLGNLGLDSQRRFEEEYALWGGAADSSAALPQSGGRSPIEIQIEVDRSTVQVDDSNPTYQDNGFYALWPAQEQDQGNIPAASRYEPGIRFWLTCRVSDGSPNGQQLDLLKRVVRAWILFGGYGGRTRRGLGSLTVAEAMRQEWLPDNCTRQSLHALLGGDLLAPMPAPALSDLPLFRGAELYKANNVTPSGITAWHGALRWLKDFRQKAAPNSARDPDFARRYGKRPHYIGPSNWPEADKLRNLAGRGPWAHTPRHNNTPVWPRAGFGLPIVGQFIGHNEPGRFVLTWYEPAGNNAWKERDRLASPLIVKAMPLANGQFAPIALWLFRGYPTNGKVGTSDRAGNPCSRFWNSSLADFDKIVDARETPQFNALNGITVGAGERLKTAFFRWLNPTYATRV